MALSSRRSTAAASRSLEEWFVARSIRPRIVGELEDSALLPFQSTRNARPGFARATL